MESTTLAKYFKFNARILKAMVDVPANVIFLEWTDRMGRGKRNLKKRAQRISGDDFSKHLDELMQCIVRE